MEYPHARILFLQLASFELPSDIWKIADEKLRDLHFLENALYCAMCETWKLEWTRCISCSSPNALCTQCERLNNGLYAMFECSTCDESVCRVCVYPCAIDRFCGTYFCRNCAREGSTCDDCSVWSCRACISTCSLCRKIYCDTCAGGTEVCVACYLPTVRYHLSIVCSLCERSSDSRGEHDCADRAPVYRNTRSHTE